MKNTTKKHKSANYDIVLCGGQSYSEMVRYIISTEGEMTLSPQRLQELGDAGLQAASMVSRTDVALDFTDCASGWDEQAPARAAMAEKILRDSGFYELLEAAKGIIESTGVRIDDPRIKHFDAARAAIAKAEGKP